MLCAPPPLFEISSNFAQLRCVGRARLTLRGPIWLHSKGLRYLTLSLQQQQHLYSWLKPKKAPNKVLQLQNFCHFCRKTSFCFEMHSTTFFSNYNNPVEGPLLQFPSFFESAECNHRPFGDVDNDVDVGVDADTDTDHLKTSVIGWSVKIYSPSFTAGQLPFAKVPRLSKINESGFKQILWLTLVQFNLELKLGEVAYSTDAIDGASQPADASLNLSTPEMFLESIFQTAVFWDWKTS